MKIRDRIVGLRRVRASELHPHPQNWRTHPRAQVSALRGAIEEIGFADAILARETPDGHLQIIDGHCRAEISEDEEVPVLVLDLDEDEAKKLLATLDPLAAMAEADREALGRLLSETTAVTESEALRTAMEGLAEREGVDLLAAGDGEDELLYPKQRVKEWRDVDGFFECPPEIEAELLRKDTLIVQFSGGKDSLAALLWVTKCFPETRRLAVFVDTGVEFPGLGAYVTDMAERLGAEPVILKPAAEWWAWLAKEGQWPSMIYRPCMMKFIHGPWGKFVREKYAPETTAVFTGSRAEEAIKGSPKTATSALDSLGSKKDQYLHFAPCFNVKKDVIEQVIAGTETALWEGYGRGFVRTACWCCMGQRGEQACALQDNYPGLADEIRRWEKRIGPLKPLSEKKGRKGVWFDDVLAAGRERLAKQNAQ